jgi:hypothetical protein
LSRRHTRPPPPKSNCSHSSSFPHLPLTEAFSSAASSSPPISINAGYTRSHSSSACSSFLRRPSCYFPSARRPVPTAALFATDRQPPAPPRNSFTLARSPSPSTGLTRNRTDQEGREQE